ncbi:uncharacterized protein LOC133789826 [Humulus lupulus]|uniref:uncharacterized protein LOC133789826 n=1 Tax=Humulus lupulus TaxID=3486 RepID=UPI002B40C4A3|nr:uncharacterized protein LOC133789826 [Humulus lupulus]
MDLRPRPISGKNKPLKSKPIQKMPKASIITSTIPREKRVFGTIRNSNILTRTLPEKPTIKPSVGVPRKKPPTSKPTRPEPATEAPKKNSPGTPKPKLNQGSICIEEEKKTSISGHRTPVNSSQSKLSASKFYSAKICSKCQFDRLETSSYWVGQIKLAESVGKHFASLAFFRLAIESNAEPIEKLDLELKRYLSRNGGLSEDNEWKEVCSRYGILLLKKNESENGEREDFGSAIKELSSTQTTYVNVEGHHVFC